MTCVSCLIGPRYVEPFVFCIFLSLLFFLLLSPCDARYPSQLLKEVSLIRRHWSVCGPVVFAHLQCGIDPRTSEGWIVASYMLIRRQMNRSLTCMCMEVTFLVSLAWSFPSPWFGRLCSHVANCYTCQVKRFAPLASRQLCLCF